MKWTLFPWAFAPALVAPLFFVDNGANTTPSGLTPIQAVPAQDIQAWKERLTARDLDQREEAYGAFVEALVRDPDLRRAAEGWRAGADTELAWTTRLALRVSRDTSNSLSRRTPFAGRGFGPSDMRSQLDDMQRQFGDLDRLFDDFQKRLDQQGSGGGLMPRTFSAPGGSRQQQQQSYSMQVTPDGLKVEVEENIDGKIEKKTYEAKTLEELYDAHPELKGKVGARVEMRSVPGGSWQDDGQSFFLGTPRAGGGLRPIQPLPLQGGVATNRLGVRIGEMTEQDRQNGALDAGVGLKVASIEDHSIAEKIGIEPGDVIVEINGRVVKGAPDVLETLAQRKPDQDVSVTVVDGEGKKRALTWRAPSAKPLGSERVF